MTASVSVHDDTEHPELAIAYARLLQHWKRTSILPSVLGRDGMWELNNRTCDSQIHKIHIRLPDETPWKGSKAQIDRVSNHYLVYVEHWLDGDQYQVISIMSPNAHELAPTSFLAELERRAEEFQSSL
ncbi:type II toxin-antitoxin system YafO family toxin [Symbiopectobacterium purcellii]|uniref:type II toxin-antitoxin system YafO family toxin n=1 Tax=Symbiopectobacterium purcellii TaxID=2871826 RepID=UPI003F85320B